MTNINQIADFLLTNRFQQHIVENIPESIYPGSVDEAYKVQAQVVSQLAKKYSSKTCGYKLACTNTMAMELLGVTGPFSGRMLSHSTHRSGVALNADNFVRRVVELEFAFVMGQDVPVSREPYTAQSIKPFISEFMPGIEIVDHRFKDFTRVGGNALIADNAIHGASILADQVSQWRSTDLSRHPVAMIVNHKIFSHGSGENVLGDPLNVMAWLAGHLQSRDSGLKSGDFVTTGTACAVYEAQAGDTIRADFGELGSVSVSFI